MDPLVMDFSSKKWPRADLITKNRRFLFIKSSGHFFGGKTCFANRGFFGLQTKDYVFLLEPQYIFLEYSNIFLEYSNMFLEYAKWGRSDDEHPKFDKYSSNPSNMDKFIFSENRADFLGANLYASAAGLK